MIEVDFTIDRFERIKLDLIRYPAGEIGYRLPYEEAITQIIVTPEITGGKSSLLEDNMLVFYLVFYLFYCFLAFIILGCVAALCLPPLKRYSEETKEENEQQRFR